MGKHRLGLHQGKHRSGEQARAPEAVASAAATIRQEQVPLLSVVVQQALDRSLVPQVSGAEAELDLALLPRLLLRMSYVIHLRLVVTPPRRRRDLRSGEAAEVHLVEVALLPSEEAALRLEVTPVASPAMLGREIRLGEVVVLAQARNKSERK